MDAKIGIIGAGPGGISAAVQLKRYGLDSVIFERDRIGGLIVNANLVENTMLYPEGISGTDMVEIMENYAKKYEINPLFQEVKRVVYDGCFTVETAAGKHEFEYLIVATGTRPRRLPYHCIYYHITELNKSALDRVLVVGGGDIALDYSLALAEFASEVIILHRSKLKAIPALQRMVAMRKNIRLVKGMIIDIQCKKPRYVKSDAGVFEVDAVLGAIGRIPNIDIVRGINSEKLFIVGDAKNGIFRQSSLAIADGIRSAMMIWRMIKYEDSK